ncbi:MAG: hypothetical protein AAFQ22_12435 [Pseudomonadota bacterium]
MNENDEDWRFYSLWLEDISKLREARRQTSVFFVSLNLAAFGALGFVLSPESQIPAHFIYVALPALWLANVSWLATDGWYARLTWKKFLFLHEIERELLRSPLTDEVGGGKPYRTLGWWLAMERVLPVLFSVSFLGAALSMVPLPGWLSRLIH